jgi:uncharacterized membrane protein YeaQ/YmgE (transglycosylase-associated protein family)
MSSLWYVFWLLQFCIGVLVGLYAPKHSPGRGLIIAIVLGLAGIVEFVIVSTLMMNRSDINFVAQVLSVMFFGLVLWGISLFCVFAGYSLAFWISKRLVAGADRFGVLVLFSLGTIYAFIAALGVVVDG